MSRIAGNGSRRHFERGASLVISLIMLVVILILGISAAHLAMQNEKASRNDRDRQIAFQAAEAALMDAELDIENSPDAAHSRSHLFSKERAMDFSGEGDADCQSGAGNPLLGLCRHKSEGQTPAWLSVDFSNEDDATASSVPYGKFTGQAFQAGKGALPRRVPRYVIELMNYNMQGESADTPTYFYRITAIGYGARESTQVVLQTFYRKED